jgi:hypothetical protein
MTPDFLGVFLPRDQTLMPRNPPLGASVTIERIKSHDCVS